MNDDELCQRCGHRRRVHATDEQGWPENCDVPECVCERFVGEDDDDE